MSCLAFECRGRLFLPHIRESFTVGHSIISSRVNLGKELKEASITSRFGKDLLLKRLPGTIVFLFVITS
jgi:hypothetical protein